MRSQNHHEVSKAYRQFSGYLVIGVAIAVLSFLFYRHTAQIEVARIVTKTDEYDKIYARQTEIIHQIDSLYFYTTLLNTNLNDAALMNVANRRKQELLSEIGKMNTGDVRLHKMLLMKYNGFLSVKDSIRILKLEEELVKSDLMKCMEENRTIARKLRMGGITINR